MQTNTDFCFLEDVYLFYSHLLISRMEASCLSLDWRQRNQYSYAVLLVQGGCTLGARGLHCWYSYADGIAMLDWWYSYAWLLVYLCWTVGTHMLDCWYQDALLFWYRFCKVLTNLINCWYQTALLFWYCRSMTVKHCFFDVLWPSDKLDAFLPEE